MTSCLNSKKEDKKEENKMEIVAKPLELNLDLAQ